MTSRRDFLRQLLAGAASATLLGGLLTNARETIASTAPSTTGKCYLLDLSGDSFVYLTAMEVGPDGRAHDELSVEDHQLADLLVYDQEFPCDGQLQLSIGCGDNTCMMRVAINRLATYRWVSELGRGISYSRARCTFDVEHATPGSIVAVQATFISGSEQRAPIEFDDSAYKWWEDVDDDVDLDDWDDED